MRELGLKNDTDKASNQNRNDSKSTFWCYKEKLQSRRNTKVLTSEALAAASTAWSFSSDQVVPHSPRQAPVMSN